MTRRRIAVIGTGGIGSALAGLFSRHGHDVVLGSRVPKAAERQARSLGATGVFDYRTAARKADLLCFCIPWEHSASAISQLGDMSGKVLIDPSNPEAADGRSLAVGHLMLLAEMRPAGLIPFEGVVAEQLAELQEIGDPSGPLQRHVQFLAGAGHDAVAVDGCLGRVVDGPGRTLQLAGEQVLAALRLTLQQQ